MGTVKGVLLDSGGVLIRPIGGRWNPRLDFEPTVLALAPHLTEDDFRRAIDVGEQYWESVPPSAHSRDDYHRAMLLDLGVAPTEALLADLGRPLDPSTIVEPYPEVIAVLEQVRANGIKMAVVSDMSPGLVRLHEGVGIANFFEAYAISALLGCTKPDPRMYAHASDALGLAPSECLFVDDVPELVAAAIELGYQGAAVLRGDEDQGTVSVPSIPDLTGLLALLSPQTLSRNGRDRR